MANINVSYAKLAEIALSVIDQASVKADDHTLAMVQGARTLLRGIASGSLTVVQPAVHKPGPARGSEGVIPA